MLLARHILDFFRFFVLEDMVQSSKLYLEHFAPSLSARVHPTDQFEHGIDGVLAGMRSTNISLFVHELGREFAAVDLIALNAYSAYGAFTGNGATRDSCTQFVFFRDATRGAPDVAGGTIAGRNMDGENDIRKLTVNMLLIHAVEPTEPALQKYVHVLWPGFVGASSGFNENGLYLMENAGCSPPGSPPARTTILRDVVSTLLSSAGNPPNPIALTLTP